MSQTLKKGWEKGNDCNNVCNPVSELSVSETSAVLVALLINQTKIMRSSIFLFVSFLFGSTCTRHPWTNDLGWVLSDLDNVFVGKFDNEANDDSQIDDWLQSRGIPNLFMLPADRKANRDARKIEFGQSNEDDQGPCPERISAMVRFVYRHMEADEKFNEDKYVARGELIQGVNGFLSQDGYAVQGHDGTKWVDILNGPVMKAAKGGKYKTFGGAKSFCENGHLAEKPWKKALRAAGLYDAKVRRGSLAADSANDVTAVDLVIVKLKQQLDREIKKAEIELTAAFDLCEQAKKIGHVDTTAFCAEPVRTAYFHMKQIRIMSVNTAEETFEASAEVVLRWWMPFGDVMLLKEDKDAWSPPPLVIRNAKEDQKITSGDSVVTYFPKDGKQWWGQQTTQISCAFMEPMDLQNFPFDIQSLQINLSFKSDPGSEWVLAPDLEKPVLTLDKTFTRLSEFEIPADKVIAEFYTENYGARINQFNAEEMDAGDAGSGKTAADDIRPGVTARVVAKRCWKRYLWSIGYIMALLGVIGNSAFRLDPVEEYGDRLGTFFTLLLTTIAFQVVVDERLPNMPYLSLIEIYIICMNVLIILQLLEAFISRTWHKQFAWDDTVEGQEGDEDKDILFAYLNGVVWAVVHIVFFLVIKYRIMPVERKRIAELTSPESLKTSNAEMDAKTHEGQKYITRNEDSYQAAFLSEKSHKLATVQERRRAVTAVDAADPAANIKVKTNPIFDGRANTNNSTDAEGDFCAPGSEDPLCVGNPLDNALKLGTQSCKDPNGGSSWWGETGTGGMARDELQKLWPRIFKRLDADGNGTITQKEIVAATGGLYEPIVKLLKDADADGDGEVTRTEWTDMFAKMLSDYGDPSPRTAELLRTFVTSGTTTGSEAAVEEFTGFDPDP